MRNSALVVISLTSIALSVPIRFKREIEVESKNTIRDDGDTVGVKLDQFGFGSIGKIFQQGRQMFRSEPHPPPPAGTMHAAVPTVPGGVHVGQVHTPGTPGPGVGSTPAPSPPPEAHPEAARPEGTASPPTPQPAAATHETSTAQHERNPGGATPEAKPTGSPPTEQDLKGLEPHKLEADSKYKTFTYKIPGWTVRARYDHAGNKQDLTALKNEEKKSWYNEPWKLATAVGAGSLLAGGVLGHELQHVPDQPGQDPYALYMGQAGAALPMGTSQSPSYGLTPPSFGSSSATGGLNTGTPSFSPASLAGLPPTGTNTAVNPLLTALTAPVR